MRVQIKLPVKERGAVLIVGLIMLLLLTVIGLASIRGSDMQERMAGNMRDRNIGFQAAEAALRTGEMVSSDISALAVPRAINSNGYFDNLNITVTGRPTRPALWDKAIWETGTNSIKLADETMKKVVDQPRYVIEKIIVPFDSANQGGGVDTGSPQDDKFYYRITSRGLGGTADSEVVLQSTYIAN
ncbi:MAG: PilX N-terminal domain-containing pilus assembly protein [Pseudomonadota bacterium]